MRPHALLLLLRPSRGDASTVALPVLAFAIVGSVEYLVAALARLFWMVPDDGFGQYKILAIGLLAVLVIPAGTLGASAARLSARRREDRLAVLRLFGASAAWVRGIAVVEASLLAAAGALIGVIGYAVLAPLLVWLPVAGHSTAFGEVWLPAWMLALLALALVVVSAVSAALGLRRVIISPLGVRMRTNAPRLHWMRLVIGAGVLAGGVILLRFTSVNWGAAGITAAIVVVLVAVMSVLNLVGPFLIGLFARRRLARARTAEELIASRGVLESPAAAWRQVSGVGLASFIAVPAGSVLGFLTMVENGTTALEPEQLMFFGDVRTVVIAAVAISYLLVACSIGVTQAAAVLERRGLSVSLDRLGMPLRVMERARRLAVASPLLIAAVFPALAATVLVAPVVGVTVFTAPLFIVTVVVCIALGVLLVRLGVTATTPVLRRVLAEPDRAL
ncbi:MAG TPA: FtsX-like permease family protein [Plantibacter sp.]|uniref:FtsX-like permease family protein n=1 Tax=unclassified Plantibacter TaxID=2624265 RepID=UPI002C8C6005|nr:FtsX-like permease family protein [Plantibacter sp.]